MNYLKSKIHKILHWEYWYFEAVYYPIFIVWFYYALKSKSFFFFNAANPSIRNGGMAMESKKEIYDLIPEQYIPKTLLFKKKTALNKVVDEAVRAGISFPLIAKPDIGMKAYAVERICNEAQLQSYIHKIPGDYLIQELINYPNEIGIFYVRFPDDESGKITGIVSKEFLSVTGNGRDTIMQLIKQNSRSYFQLPVLTRQYGDLLNRVLPIEDKFILVPYGSHTRGSKFTDISHKINEKLLNTINTVCTKIPGFYFGRIDIRYSTLEELCNGINFSIIEINGAGSEPTHIYDPEHSVFFAWKEIIRHWRLLFQISRTNFKKGNPYLNYKDGRNMLKANKKLEAQLKMI